ncbi:MAG TPA: hypothetical protein VFV38_10710 [Ktedonobacteraceae bacterium]|nr:hypothetical protein [Ktedonobacteraceae bacterium]
MTVYPSRRAEVPERNFRKEKRGTEKIREALAAKVVHALVKRRERA